MMVARSRLAAAAAVVTASFFAFVLWPKSSSATAEEVIRRKMVNMARAADGKDLSYIMDQVSDRFSSPEGWQREDLHRVLAGQILRGSWVRVFPADVKVVVTSGTTATVSGKFIFGRSNAVHLKDLARESVMSSFAVEAKVEKEGDEWKFIFASHREIDPSEFL